tara:strand:- start:2517 stop:2720 length:204 start_codon:yes stop_codon:yes gene_type:complete
MGEAKRRKDLGLKPRPKEIKMKSFDKKIVQEKVRNTLYKYPIIPFIFYGLAIAIFIFGIINVIHYYK